MYAIRQLVLSSGGSLASTRLSAGLATSIASASPASLKPSGLCPCDDQQQPSEASTSGQNARPSDQGMLWSWSQGIIIKHTAGARQLKEQLPWGSMALHGLHAYAPPGARSTHTQALQHPNQQKKPAKYTPWTFSRFLQGRHRSITQRMGFLIQSLEEEQVRASLAAKQIPDFKAGDILEVRMIVPEAGKKEYIIRGLCIGRYNKGVRSAFKLYNVYAESGGVVQHIPLHMPDLLSVRVVGHIPVRRNKLYYLLDPSGKYETYQYQYQAEPQPVAAETDATPAGKDAGKKAAAG
eukprot:CAMPEP_0202862184 /NCGR_PEP_ID=MMETSP1391-20130828/3318_1 /ASSEMBLY_ACC=CAM_ASM_000867 /TAXON_ID=1034604 /ORGANISM="Chlamydomonas leiostraca, Strain SAG 11-49" /LENGTH=293 /DNA_ID=CAMNT_0049541681 /DNA_START=17 /DNA_END=895 /DNA_ORIENTATION=-